MKRHIPPVLLVICPVLMAVLLYAWPLRIVIPPPYHWLGVLVIALGFAFGLPAARRFRLARTNFDTFAYSKGYSKGGNCLPSRG
jgi:hypothetical protein